MVYDGKSGRVHPTASHTSPIATEWSAACITDEVTGKAAEGFKPRVKNLNLIGPKVRRLRHQRSWSQNDLAIRLQLLGMEDGTRCRVSKIEVRLVSFSDEVILWMELAFRKRAAIRV
jgi:hypothetical protein